ncbi:MAG: hypothetical protein AB7E85_01750 [Pseudobdellovibrionaceae bacterium]
MLALQARVASVLPEDQKSFFLPKDGLSLGKHFYRNKGRAIGVRDDRGELVGQSIVFEPTAGQPYKSVVDDPDQPAFAQMTVLQSVLVDPSARKMKLMHKMVAAWMDDAREQGRTYATAEIETANIGSWKGFLEEGMVLVGRGKDQRGRLSASTGEIREKYMAVCRLDRPFTYDPDLTVSVKPDAYAEIGDLFESGWKCVKWDRQAQEMVFARENDFQPR